MSNIDGYIPGKLGIIDVNTGSVEEILYRKKEAASV
jgi:hypothetical protein